MDEDAAAVAAVAPDETDFSLLPPSGQEVVLSADFDRYGTRMVTGSADHRIRVFDLDETTKEWILVEAWRAHNADVIDVKFHPMLSRPAFLASIGSDIRLKLWYENTLETTRSGRRFRCVYSQSPSHGVVYTSIDFACPPSLTSAISPYATILAMITRDGLLSLLEPVEVPSGGTDPIIPGSATMQSKKITVPGGLDEWREVDQIWMFNDKAVSRGIETSFKLAFQRGDPAGIGAGANYLAVDAGLDSRAMTLAVTALDAVHVFRIVGSGPDGDGPYQFHQPVAELTGAEGLVRDVAWAPASWRPRDRVATAGADGYIRLYEIWTPEEAAATRNRFAGGLGKAPSGISAGLAGASRAAGDRRIEPAQIQHQWAMISQLKHPGVWKIAWLREGSMLVSTADSGKAVVWAQAFDGSWKEFADFGPDSETGIRPRN